MVIGALVFLGCPLRLILRLGNGDLNAITGLLGYLLGIFIGVQFLKGYTLGKSADQPKISGYVVPVVAIVFVDFLNY